MHSPVLLQEAIEGLNLKGGMTVLDGTLGGGGHAEEIIKLLGSSGTFVGLDADEDAVSRVEDRLKQYRLHKFLRVANFRDLAEVLATLEIKSLDAALFDLGLSSFQLEASGRGFSFERDEPLLMTFDATPTGEGLTARSLLATMSEEDLRKMFFESGEKYARKIAHVIHEARGSITSSKLLAEIVVQAVPPHARKGRTHPATKVFQAIRMKVNDEIASIETGLRSAWNLISKGGRMAVISFHSGEDRAVKFFGKDILSSKTGRLVNKKPIIPSSKEVRENPRSRSAKLRVFEKNND